MHHPNNSQCDEEEEKNRWWTLTLWMILQACKHTTWTSVRKSKTNATLSHRTKI
jgi:hypothetical protein